MVAICATQLTSVVLFQVYTTFSERNLPLILWLMPNTSHSFRQLASWVWGGSSENGVILPGGNSRGSTSEKDKIVVVTFGSLFHFFLLKDGCLPA